MPGTGFRFHETNVLAGGRWIKKGRDRKRAAYQLMHVVKSLRRRCGEHWPEFIEAPGKSGKETTDSLFEVQREGMRQRAQREGRERESLRSRCHARPSPPLSLAWKTTVEERGLTACPRLGRGGGRNWGRERETHGELERWPAKRRCRRERGRVVGADRS